MIETKAKNIVVFSESNGRFLIGNKVSSTKTHASIENPYIVEAREQEGKMAIGFIPYIYLELIDPESEGVWEFPYATCSFNNMTVSADSVTLYERIVEMYGKARLDMQQSDGEVVTPDDSKIISMTD